MLQIRKGH